MYGNVIKRIIQNDARTRSQFCGVFAANELPYQLPYSLAIVNCCNADREGIHWLAICQEDDDTLEFFDSFGLPPDMYNLTENLPETTAISYNSRQLQSYYSEVCGHYCLYYCYFKVRGYRMSDIVSIFSNDYDNNDLYVYNAVKKLYKL